MSKLDVTKFMLSFYPKKAPKDQILAETIETVKETIAEKKCELAKLKKECCHPVEFIEVYSCGHWAEDEYDRDWVDDGFKTKCVSCGETGIDTFKIKTNNYNRNVDVSGSSKMVDTYSKIELQRKERDEYERLKKKFE